MSFDVNFEKYQPDDREEIVEISLRAWEPIYRGYEEALGQEIFNMVYPDWKGKKREETEKMCDDENCFVYVVRDGDRIVSFVSYYMDENKKIGTVGYNGVHPDYQGRGIGNKMYKFVLERLKDHGMKCATVITGGDDAHLPARKGYERAGFSKHLQSRRYYCLL